MKIIQLTDMHVDSPSDDTHGIDVRTNFEKTLNAAVSRKPDLLILTGDLCHTEGDKSTYDWIKNKLNQIDIPYEIISGNHDDNKLLTETFNLENDTKGGELFFERSHGDYKLHFLDSSTYHVSKQQQDWLQVQLNQSKKPFNLFIHHPPCEVGALFMDSNYPLKNWEEIQAILLSTDRKVNVFCGHYHTDKITINKNLTVFVTPSTYVQIAGNNQDFQVAHNRIGYREIILKGESLRTEVFWLESNVLV